MNKAQLKKAFWMFFTLALSVLTVGTLLKQSESMSVETLIEKISNADLKWICTRVFFGNRFGCGLVFPCPCPCCALSL